MQKPTCHDHIQLWHMLLNEIRLAFPITVAIYAKPLGSSPGVLLPTSGLWPQFLGRAFAALRSIGMTN